MYKNILLNDENIRLNDIAPILNGNSRDFLDQIENSIPPITIFSDLYYEILTKENKPDYKTIEKILWLHQYKDGSDSVILGDIEFNKEVSYVNPELYFIWIKFFGSDITSHLLALVTHFYSKRTNPKFITDYSKIQNYFNEELIVIKKALNTLKEYGLMSYTEQSNGLIEIYINYKSIDNFALPLNQPEYEQEQELNNYYCMTISDLFECPFCYEKLDNKFLKYIQENYNENEESI